MSISLKNLLFVLSSIDPAGYFKFGGAVLKIEVVLGLSAVAHGRTIERGEICGEVGGETSDGPRIVLEIEGVVGDRKVRRRCARKVVGVCILRARSALEEGRINCLDILQWSVLQVVSESTCVDPNPVEIKKLCKYVELLKYDIQHNE